MALLAGVRGQRAGEGVQAAPGALGEGVQKLGGAWDVGASAIVAETRLDVWSRSPGSRPVAPSTAMAGVPCPCPLTLGQ